MKSGILFDSLPMTRLGFRGEEKEVVLAPDFSTFAYMLEEYITLATAYIAIPKSSPEVGMLSALPELLKKRIVVIDDAPERESASRLLEGVRTELGIAEFGDQKRLRFRRSTPREVKDWVIVVHHFLVQFATGFNHGVQVGISSAATHHALRGLRGQLQDASARAILAQIEGILATYGDVTFDSPHPNATAAPELIALFDRLLSDSDYLQLSNAVSDLALPHRRADALTRVSSFSRKLISNSVVAKGWNYAGTVVKAWTGVPVPDADTILSFVSGKNFPVLADLRGARKRAIEAWLKTARTTNPVSAIGDNYEGYTWVLPAKPPESWDGGHLSAMSLGTVDELIKELKRFPD